MKYRFGVAVVCSLISCSLSCQPAPLWPAGSFRPQRTVTIRLHGVTIGPSHASGREWDGGGIIPAEVRDLARLVGSTKDPKVWLAKYSARVAFNYLSKPDPYGRVDVYLGDVYQRGTKLLKQDQTLEPSWQAEWSGVSWDSNPRVVFTLNDSDPIKDEPIGSFILTAAALKPALLDGKVHLIAVGDQTRDQVLTVSMSVVAERWTPDGSKDRSDSVVGDDNDSIVRLRCDRLAAHSQALADAEQSPAEAEARATRREQILQSCLAVPPTEDAYLCRMQAASIAEWEQCRAAKPVLQ